MTERLLDIAQWGCDRLFELHSYARPDREPAPKLIAHRGAWSSAVQENSLQSFVEAARLGAWGVEFDIHFTADGVPVVNHDPDLLRCYRVEGRIAELSRAELRSRAPNVCGLADVLALSRLHFMIEVKTKLNAAHAEGLGEILKGLKPAQDYHLLCLTPDLVRIEPHLPPPAWILVGELNLTPWVRESLNSGLGGVAGHYLGMTRRHIESLHAAKQIAGSGFIPSENLLRREWARGVDWVFTNTLDRVVNGGRKSTS